MSQIQLQNRILALQQQNNLHTGRILEIQNLFVKNGAVMPSSVFNALRSELSEIKHLREMNNRTIAGLENLMLSSR